jgi:hypothetical protein
VMVWVGAAALLVVGVMAGGADGVVRQATRSRKREMKINRFIMREHGSTGLADECVANELNN